MAELTIKIIIGLMLLLCGMQDLRTRKIALWIIIVSATLLIVCVSLQRVLSLPDIVGGMAIGISVVAISYITRGKIGLGDGLLLCTTGIGLGFWTNLELFAIALLLAAVVSIILLVLRLADRKKSIPFVPFMFLAYVFIAIANFNLDFT